MVSTREHSPRVLLIRHGQTTWSATDRHTGRTDIDLTDRGEADAAGLIGIAERLDLHDPLVIASPRRRALRTAAIAGLPVAEHDELFAEWDYGHYEGITRAQIQAEYEPGWSVWTHGAAGGESVAQMTARVDQAVAYIRELLPSRDVVVVSHGHFSRSFICRFLGWPIACGAQIDLRPAGLALLADLGGEPRLLHLVGPEGATARIGAI